MDKVALKQRVATEVPAIAGVVEVRWKDNCMPEHDSGCGGEVLIRIDYATDQDTWLRLHTRVSEVVPEALDDETLPHFNIFEPDDLDWHEAVDGSEQLFTR